MRIGLGTMQMCGSQGWGDAPNPENAKHVIRHAYDSGVRLFDSAGFYGPDVALRLLRESLPTDDSCVISTKVGINRADAKQWVVDASASAITKQVEHDLKTLGVERLPLVFLRLGDNPYLPRDPLPLAESMAALVALQQAGKIDQIGLSQCTVADLNDALQYAPIAAVQNPFGLMWQDDSVLRLCTDKNMTFVAYAPLGGGKLLKKPSAYLTDIAARYQATPAQVALAWVLQRHPSIRPIPATTQISHVDELIGALNIPLTAVERAQLAQFL